MSIDSPGSAADPARPRSGEFPAFPPLLLLSVGSGGAALVYQVVWFQLLGLVIGASAVSLGVLLATFMGGMCLGSWLLPRVIAPRRHPLRVYALLELGIGLAGLSLLYGLPALGGAYTAWAGSGTAGLLWRAVVAGLCLLPPTMLMGATLPAIARWVETTPRGVSRLGFLYGANIGGAVLGALLAGFYLLRVHDVAVATFWAAGVNAAVACASLWLAGRTAYRSRSGGWRQASAARAFADPPGPGAPPARAADPQGWPAAPAHAPAAWPVHAAIALSGMTALSAEVLWTRHLSLLLGATVYTFALILAVFLLGLGIGSGVGAALSRRLPARAALGACQLLLCAAMAWAAYTVARVLPYWPLDVTLPSTSWAMLHLDSIRVASAALPAALLWGASFPLALAAAAAPGEDPGRLAGGLYAANTAGAIVGALATSFWLVVWLGSQQAQQMLILISAGSGLLMIATLDGRARRLGARRAAAGAAALAAALALAYSVPRLPGELVAYGRFLPTRGLGADVIYVGEGLTSSIAVSRDENGMLTYHNAGKAQASSYPQDMRLQRMLGHLATLVADDPETCLVIGLGAGVTAGAVAIDPAVDRVVIAEIEPLARKAASEHFRAQNHGVIGNPKAELRIDDGRHYLATTDETFDVITSDPLDPWVKGAAALYTQEFWELVRSRLNPGGTVTVFLQLYENTEAAVRSEAATFFEVFPNGAVFANTVQGMGYDAVLLGRAGDVPIDVDRMQARLRSPDYRAVARSLREVGFHSAPDLLGTYAGGAADLSAWLEGAPINRDRNLRLQYLAGQGLNLYRAEAIFANMRSAGTDFPDRLFTGSPELVEQVRRRIRARQGRF